MIYQSIRGIFNKIKKKKFYFVDFDIAKKLTTTKKLISI